MQATSEDASTGIRSRIALVPLDVRTVPVGLPGVVQTTLAYASV